MKPRTLRSPPAKDSCRPSYRGRNKLLSGFRAQSFEEIFGKQRNGREANASCIFHGVDDCRCGSVHGQLSDTFGAMRAVNVAQFFKKYANRGQVHRSRHDVIRHLIVAHPAVLPDNFFIEGETDGLRDSPMTCPSASTGCRTFPTSWSATKSSTVTL